MIRRLFGTISSPGPVQGPGWLEPQALHLLGLLQDSWEPARSTAPSIGKQVLSSARETWMLEVTGGNKDEVANTGGLFAPTQTVVTDWKELGHDGPDTDSPWSGWRVGLCERPGHCMEWEA